MRIEQRVGIRLVHVTGREWIPLVSSTIYYRVQTAWVDRPVSGSRAGRLRCATCGQMVGLRVRDQAATLTRKRWCLGIAAGATVALAALVLWAAQHEVFSGAAPASPYLIFLVAAGLLVATASMCAWMGLSEDGVGAASWKPSPRKQRSSSRPSGEHAHAFRPLSPLQACRRPPDGDRPQHPEIVFD